MKKNKPVKKLPEWDLSTLVASPKQLQALQDEIAQKATQFESYRSKLSIPTPTLIRQIILDSKLLAEKSSILGGYVSLQFAQNTQDEKAKALDSQLSNFLAQQSTKMLFFSIWWKNLDDKTAESLLPSDPDDRYFLQETRRFKKHILTEPEEKIITTKDVTGSEALSKLYDVITNEFTYQWKDGKKIKTLSREEVSGKWRSQKAADRIQAYDLVWKRYQAHEGTLGEIYRNIAQDSVNETIPLRHYNSPISARNLGNNLTDETVSSFLAVCQKNASLFQEYFQWKSKKLRIPNSRYHIYAPLPFKEKKVSFESSWKTVMNVFESFSPHMRKLAEKVRIENRLDVPIRKGKQTGAFCAGISPKQTSFVLLNWTGKDRDESTLAHELGHAVHNHLASNRSIFTHHAGLPLAETASTFAEMLLDEYLLEKNPSPSYQQHALSQQLDDAYASIMRQSYFCAFEQQAFQMISDGKTIPEISEAYYKNLQNQFGSKMKIPIHARYEWLSIPHFYHSPFYVYAYAFGQLLVLSLYEQYKEEGKSFVPKYEKFLSYGGSKKPEEMLLEIGFDPNQKSSWQQGFDLLEEKMKQLKKM